MNLTDFERRIEPRILERGRQYFEDGRVRSIVETAPHVYEALVEGTDCYTVAIVLDESGKILESGCECPYDWSEYCKHQVAAFLALRELLEDKPGPQPESHPSQKTSGKSRGQASPDQPARTARSIPYIPKQNWKTRLEQALHQRSKDELVRYLMVLAERDAEIRHQALLRFGSGDEQEIIEQSIQLIRSQIRNAANRRGYIEYDSAAGATRGADTVLQNARKALAQRNFQHALDLVLVVLHEMISLLQECDDSGGFVGGVIEESLSLIGQIAAGHDSSPGERAQLFDKLITEAANKRYDGWTHWQLDLLNSCAALADIPILRKRLEGQLEALMNSKSSETSSGRYFQEKVALIQYDMVKRLDGDTAARAFVEAHLKYDDFREMAIDAAMKAEEYQTVIRLALDGEKLDREYRGRGRRWQQRRYIACQRSGRIDQQRELAITFLIDGNYEYYEELKKTYDPSEWPSVYPGIIRRLENGKLCRLGVYTRILIAENEKERLLLHVQHNPDLIEAYAQYLLPDYRETVYDLFIQHIKKAATGAASRSVYQTICGNIRSLKKAGGLEQAKQVKEYLLKKYNNRPALKDELSRV